MDGLLEVVMVVEAVLLPTGFRVLGVILVTGSLLALMVVGGGLVIRCLVLLVVVVVVGGWVGAVEPTGYSISGETQFSGKVVNTVMDAKPSQLGGRASYWPLAMHVTLEGPFKL